MRTRFLALTALLLASAAAACSDDNSTNVAAEARLRVVHASPDAPAVDVLVDGAVALTAVPFEAASAYLAVPAGARNIQVRASGTTTVVIDATPTLAAGTDYTVVAVGPVASIEPLLLTDDNTPPAAGNAKVRLVHASPTAGLVDIYITAPGADIAALAPALANVDFKAASPYVAAPAGDYQVRVTAAGTKTVALDTGTLSLGAGQIRTGIALDAPGGGLPVGAIVLADLN